MVTTPVATVLVVEDDATVAEVVQRYLVSEGFAVERVDNGLAALEAAETLSPDIVVLDLMLPGMDGLEVCRRLRATSATPIIMLTALGSEVERVIGLEIGADDYIAKPFSPRELTARVKAVLRRTSPAESDRSGLNQKLQVDDVSVDVDAREITRGGSPISLTEKEFDLLVFLMRRPRQVFRREDLLEHVWGYTFGDTSTVTVHVRRLREKIESDPASPKHLSTVWGVGYRWDP